MPAPDVHVRRHSRHRPQLPRRLWVEKKPRRSKWYLDGYAEGQFAAEVNLETPEDRAELDIALEDDDLGRIASEIREHQVQMAGDISYDIDRPGGPTEAQYEKWETGFYEGFEKTVQRALKPGWAATAKPKRAGE